MKTSKIERNPLDYIISDTLPIELSEIFSYSNLYNFILRNMKTIDEQYKSLAKHKMENNNLFESGWVSVPLTYFVEKKNEGYRKISLIQPFAILNIYFFLRLYQKEILGELSNPVFSIRYHVKNRYLYYRSSKKGLISYIYKVRNIDKIRSIEQSGSFFSIQKYSSINSFVNSSEWEMLVLKYKYFTRLDYKSCFDSIYCHTYKWVKAKDTVDSKNFKNADLFSTIDRVMQNINGSISNGIVVGPEFSRMIAELLLQNIDKNIERELRVFDIVCDRDYKLFRYVDDFFLFTLQQSTQEKIIRVIESCANKYLLSLNYSKIEKKEIPFTYACWFNDITFLKEDLVKLFRTKDQIEIDIEKNLLYFTSNSINRIKVKFYKLMVDYPKYSKTIISYILSVLLNRISERKEYVSWFGAKCSYSKKLVFLEFIFYIYSFNSSFDSTQKLISILYYLNLELEFKKESKLLQTILNKYMFVFENANINDYVNLLLVFRKYGVAFGCNIEESIRSEIIKSNDPLLMSTFLVYCVYDENLFYETKLLFQRIILEKVRNIVLKEKCLEYKEFWFVLIFNKCTYIDPIVQTEIEGIISYLHTSGGKINPSQAIINLLYEFMLHETNQFITWNINHLDVAKQITFRTYQKTVFRNNYKDSKIFDSSID